MAQQILLQTNPAVDLSGAFERLQRRLAEQAAQLAAVRQGQPVPCPRCSHAPATVIGVTSHSRFFACSTCGHAWRASLPLETH